LKLISATAGATGVLAMGALSVAFDVIRSSLDRGSCAAAA
jgi:hypothetical protein